MDTVTLALEGDDIGLKDFAEAVEQFYLLIAELSREADAPKLRWEVAELSVSSAVTVAKAVEENGHEPERVDRVIRSYAAVGQGLKAGSAVQFSPAVRKPAEALTALLENGVKAIRFETPETELMVTEALEAPEPRVEVAAPTAAYGAVTGRIQTLSSRAHLRFTLYDRLDDKAVACYLREGEEELVRGAWDKMATVEGWVTRHPEHGWPISVRNITAIHKLHEGDPRDYRRARGAVPRNPESKSSEERIRHLRDAS